MSLVADSLLDQIERDALDERAFVATALRRCVALGGRSGSQVLRDWATRELDGYYGSNDLPEYRVVPAAIQLDGMTATAHIQGQAVPPSALPDPARGRIKEQVELRDGIGQIEDLANRSEIKLGLPGGGDLTRLMHAASGIRTSTSTACTGLSRPSRCEE
jgi:AbiTii